jgi:hypothetical protein
MPQCAWHPGTETNVSCPSCGRYMCPKDMVDTPVGYKCRECGRARVTRGGVKPAQLLRAAGLGLAAAVVLAPFVHLVPFFVIRAALYGGLIGEATRRGAGGHRTTEFAAIAAACAVAGVLAVAPFVGLDLVDGVLGGIVAALWVSSARILG